MLGNRKILSAVVVLCIGILPLTLAFWSLSTFENAEAELSIDPPIIVYGTLLPGKRFSVNITVANVTDLKSYKLKLSFNTAMLDVVGIVLLPEENLPVGDFIADDVLGVISINVTYDDAITTTEPLAVASITFKMMNRGESPLHLYDTELENSSGEPIPHSKVDGMILILRRDVAVVSVEPSTNETYIGRTVNVTVLVKNNGDIAENLTVKIYYNDTVFDTVEVSDLQAGENTTIVFSWNTSAVSAGHNYIIKAEVSEVPFEANTTDNVLIDGTVKIKMIGDVNNDNLVNIDDLIAWDAAYGSVEGTPNWNPQADINGDGAVDKEDGILIIENYQATP